MIRLQNSETERPDAETIFDIIILSFRAENLSEGRYMPLDPTRTCLPKVVLSVRVFFGSTRIGISLLGVSDRVPAPSFNRTLGGIDAH